MTIKSLVSVTILITINIMLLMQMQDARYGWNTVRRCAASGHYVRSCTCAATSCHLQRPAMSKVRIESGCHNLLCQLCLAMQNIERHTSDQRQVTPSLEQILSKHTLHFGIVRILTKEELLT